MVIGACTVSLYIPAVASLKEKRRWIKPLINQLRKRFDVAVAEVEHQDVWQSSDIAIVAVSNDVNYIYAVLEKAVHWIEDDYMAVQVVDWQIELR
jgi:hypothetical protein